ncbi:MAG: aminoglycoside phosphotransferase family protein [Chlamydiales bacterium]|nr:aminoglycoside phosphotransferase family protein [Chlamydiales bacterium]
MVKECFPGYIIEQHHGIDMIESTGDTDIYLLGDALVLKIYPIDDSTSYHRFEQEKKAFIFAKEHHLSIAPLIEEKTVVYDNKTYGCLLMQKADGKSLNHLIKDYASCCGDKKLQLENLQLAMKEIGSSLGKMHQIKETFSSSVKSYPDARIVNDLIRNKENISVDISTDRLKEEFLKRRDAYSPIMGLTHKDLHPGNIFIGDNDHHVEFIDVTTLQTADVVYDMVNFISHVEAVCYFNQIDDTVVKALVSTFTEEYTKYIPVTKEHYRYQKLVMAVELIYDYNDIPDISRWAKNNLYQELS